MGDVERRLHIDTYYTSYTPDAHRYIWTRWVDYQHLRVVHERYWQLVGWCLQYGMPVQRQGVMLQLGDLLDQVMRYHECEWEDLLLDWEWSRPLEAVGYCTTCRIYIPTTENPPYAVTHVTETEHYHPVTGRPLTVNHNTQENQS